MADQSVGVVRIAAPKLSIPQYNWNASGFKLPILLRRNVSIQGPPTSSSVEWPIVDFEDSAAIMQLGGNVTLHFQYVFLPNMRDKPTRAPGLNILAPTAAGELSTVLVGPDAAASFSLCWGLAQQIQDFAAVERPKQFPGTNAVGLFDTYETLKQAGCVDDVTAPPTKRCWAIRYLVIDLAATGADYDPSRDILVLNNQVYHGYNITTYCETLVDERCYTIEGKPLLLCYMEAEKEVFERRKAASTPPSSGSGSRTATPPPNRGVTLSASGSTQSYKSDDDASGGGLTGGARVGVIAGASAAGALLVTTLLVAVTWTRQRRRLRGTTPADMEDQDEAAALEGCGGKRDGLHQQQQQHQQQQLGQGKLSGQRGPDGFSGLSEINSSSGVEAGVSFMGSTGPDKCVDERGPDKKKKAQDSAAAAAAGSSADSCLKSVNKSGGTTPTPTTSSNVQRNIKVAAVAAAAQRHHHRQQQRQQSVVTPMTRPRPEVALSVKLLDPSPPTSTTTPPEQPQTPSLQQSSMWPVFEDTKTTTEGGFSRSDSGAATAADSGTVVGDSGGGVGGGGAPPPVVELLPLVLGKGCFGRVVEGMFGGQRVAVKLLVGEGPWGVGGEQEQQDAGAQNYSNVFLQSFAQEVQVLSRVKHPNVVQLLAACVTPPRLCLVMELMEASLEKLMYGKRTASTLEAPSEQDLMPLEKVLYIGIEIANALAYLHPTIVHRDLKPANVLVNAAESDQPVVKLSDFGLSRLRFTVAPTKHPDAGTPAYMAPECFDVLNKCITHQSDMYSLGVVLWEMLGGTQPWAGMTPVAIAVQVTYQGQRLPLMHLDERRCPTKLNRLLTSCWETDPARRPAAAEAAKEMTLVLMEVTGRKN